MKRQFAVGVALLGFASAVLAGPTGIWIVNGKNVYRSTDGGSTFNNTGTVSASTNIVGLGYHRNSGTFYATGQNGFLYTVSNLDSASPTLNSVIDLGSSSISFDFAGDTLFAVRGNDLISVDLNAPAVNVVNSSTGYSNVPSTAIVGGTYYGVTGSGQFIQFNGAGAASLIGNTGLGNLAIAGGSEAGGGYYTSVGKASDGLIRFGSVNTTTGLYAEIDSFDPVAEFGKGRAGTMGMTIVIPLPTGAGLALAGLGLLAVRRRR